MKNENKQNYKWQFEINNKNTFLMSIALSAFSSVVIDFVGDVLIPVLDKNNTNFVSCIQKWQEFRQTLMKRILNFKTEEQLRQKVKMICKIQKQQKSQKQFETKTQKQPIDRYSQSKVSQDEKSNKSRTQQYTNKNVQWPKQEVINFRDRKISIDENPGRRQKREQSQNMMRKQERSNSFHANGLESDIVVEVPLFFVPGHQGTEKHKTTYATSQKKDNDILSFNSISEFHKSRNNIPLNSKQTKDNEINLQQQQINLISKKSIEEGLGSSISQARPNSFSTNYIQSIKKINIESRSPSSKSKPYYSDLDTSQDYVETTPMRGQQSQHMRTSALDSIKKRISDATDYLTSPQIGATDSFPKFLSSFKKLCTTFQSNHQKLLRQDFNNKYINC